MGLYNLPDTPGHTLTNINKDPKNQWSRHYQCSCGEFLWAYAKTDGNADRRTHRMWADHIEISNTNSDFIVELGTVQMVRSKHTYYLFTTKHPRFSDWEAPPGWMNRTFEEHKAGQHNPQWVIGVEKSRKKPPNKLQIHYFYDSKASALAGAYKQIDSADHRGYVTTRTNDLATIGLPAPIEIKTINLIDAASDLISQTDDVVANGGLSELMDVQTQIRSFLTVESLLRAKLADVTDRINELGLGRKIA